MEHGLKAYQRTYVNGFAILVSILSLYLVVTNSFGYENTATAQTFQLSGINDTLHVSGEATTHIIPDTVTVSLEIETNSADIINNQSKIDNNFVIKYSSRGGLVSQYNSILYNSTNNHLIVSQDNQTLIDTELSDNQQNILRKSIEDGKILALSFKNYKPYCCDMTYNNLKIIFGAQENSIVWSSVNEINSPYYKRIPLEVTNLVESLYNFSDNSKDYIPDPNK